LENRDLGTLNNLLIKTDKIITMGSVVSS